MFLTPEQQHQIDERWKDYNREWNSPQSMSRDQTALELEKFRYETESRYREDQLRSSRPQRNESTNGVSRELLDHYAAMGKECQISETVHLNESRRLDEEYTKLRVRQMRDNLRYRYNFLMSLWFALGVATTLLILFLVKRTVN